MRAPFPVAIPALAVVFIAAAGVAAEKIAPRTLEFLQDTTVSGYVQSSYQHTFVTRDNPGVAGARQLDANGDAVGVGTIAFRWGDLTEPTIYSLLQASVTPQNGRGLAGLALYAWETGRAADAIRFYEQARTALGDQLPEPVRRRAQPAPGS